MNQAKPVKTFQVQSGQGEEATAMVNRLQSLTSTSTLRMLREANLTAAEWRFWAYMAEQEHSNKPNQLITPADVMRECKLAKSTYHQSKLKFQELGLFEFHKSRTLLINLL